MDKVERIRVPRRIMPTFTTEQVEQMLAKCNSGFTGRRLRAILLVLVDCGLRASELCALQLDDLSWDTRVMRVMGKGSSERVVPFGEVTRDALQAYVRRRGILPGQESLFVTCYGDPLDRHDLHKFVRCQAQRAGVAGVRCSPHTFRSTLAVMYLRNGGDAFSLQRTLGHSSLEMTRRYSALAETDVMARHRLAPPGDRFSSEAGTIRGRKRIR